MRIERLERAQDPRVADYRGVRDPQWLRQRRRFVAESRQVVEALLARDDLCVESVLVTPAALEALRPQLTRGGDIPTYLVEPALLREIGGFRFHQGVLALARRPEDEALGPLLARLPARSRVLVGESITNPDNVGSLFRNARALGAHAIALDASSAHPLYRKALRTSMGASLRLPFAVETAAGPMLAELQRAGFVCVALTPDPAAESLAAVADRLRAEPRLALVLGHEGRGLSAQTRAACDCGVRIAMAEGADSVNVATASGIALHRLV